MHSSLTEELGNFKNTRKGVKSTPLIAAHASLSTSLVFLKVPACLYNSTMHLARFLFQDNMHGKPSAGLLPASTKPRSEAENIGI